MKSSRNMKVLLLTNQLHVSPSGGRELLCKMNHDILKNIFGSQCMVFELEKVQIHGIKPIISAFSGYIDGFSLLKTTEMLQEIQEKGINKVFVDGSNLGEAVRVIKKKFPSIQIYTFFHNVEARFFLGALRQYKTLHALAVLMVNYLAEKKAIRYSDKIICLNNRDSGVLKKLYGRAATHVSPMALRDKIPNGFPQTTTTTSGKFALFVGGGFYANRAGITWFVKHVVPHIGVKTCIVGRGLDDLRPQLEQGGKVAVIGAVADLAEWYREAQFVIAPIFDGSGMKTKVAEALMFGKKIVGSKEAFTGYEDVIDRAGWLCETVEDFVVAIGCAQNIVKTYDPELRALYEEKYSYSAARSRLAEIMGAV